jgi:dTDP-4-amino-4,6-dideoxygalactose transaminase
MANAFDAVRSFERALAKYTGSPFAIGTTSCTDALLVACAYLKVCEVEIPRRTFAGVAQAILNAGGSVKFRDEAWSGGYKLEPYPIYDMARRTRAGMYIPGSIMCLSFHVTKICGISDGGAILCDEPYAHHIMQMMCYDGRPISGPWGPEDLVRGFHCYMGPGTAAALHRKLDALPRDNADLPNSDYPDLSLAPIFGENQLGALPQIW